MNQSFIVNYSKSIGGRVLNNSESFGILVTVKGKKEVNYHTVP